ncbi:hypothetical protein [Solibacillus sp. CAU 1738]|uniref:hypothetical protein n=1 Tax=Solibacillus sp. CAU 1738 TaxID=3140363 RepID=UPI00325FE17D
MKKDMRFSCYPFMREKSCLVDYEIRTDSLTTRIGSVFPKLEGEEVQVIVDDLKVIHPMAYHINGSVRGKLAVTEEDLQFLSDRYDFYLQHVGEQFNRFVLPQGVEAAVRLHICRSEAKKSFRALHKVSEEREVPEILFNYLGLLANVFFLMTLYVNKVSSQPEIEFVSKSYPIKKRKEEVK